jgi:hypothetical protein
VAAPPNGEPLTGRGDDRPDPDELERASSDLEDSTIVLPLSNAPWAGRTKRDWPPASGEPADTGGAGKR